MLISSQSSLQIRCIAHYNTNDFPHKNREKREPKNSCKTNNNSNKATRIPNLKLNCQNVMTEAVSPLQMWTLEMDAVRRERGTQKLS